MPFVISPRLIRKARPVGLRVGAALSAVALLYAEPIWPDRSATHLIMDNVGLLPLG